MNTFSKKLFKFKNKCILNLLSGTMKISTTDSYPLENDPSLADRTTLTPAKIADLLTFVLRSTYFQYNGSIYKQKDGAAMGSPVSAVIANLYMESFEEQAITTSSYKPTIWKRYVDDTFTILDRGNVDDFLQHLNNQQPSIRFTMETENNNKLAFLDTAVSREPDGRLTTMYTGSPRTLINT